MGLAIVGMELAALVVAVLTFGWAVLLVGAPLLVGTLVALAVVRLWELFQLRREQYRERSWDQSAVPPGGLMSGFFEVSAIGVQPPLPRVEVPYLRAARGWAERTWTHHRSALIRRG